MRTLLLTAILFFAAASARPGEAGGVVDGQPGSTSSFKVRVLANHPGATVSSVGAASGPVVTIEEFPGVGGGDGPVVSEPVAPDGNGPRVLATLYGVPITEADVEREMWERRGAETFEWLVGRELLNRELRRLRLDVSETEVKDALDRHLMVLRKAYPNLKKTDDLTRAASGMPLDEYRERTVWAELALRKIMNAALETREEDLRVFFASVRADYIRPERVRVSQIFIPPKTDGPEGAAGPEAWAEAERQINEAHALLVRDDFEEVAKNYGSGGRLSRWMRRGDLLRELEEPAFSIKPGSITNPIRSSIGWHILMVEARENRREPTLDEVREEVKAGYEEERFVRLAGEFMARLKEKTLESGGLVMVDVPSVFANGGQ